jgi:hypothetical protein
MSREEARAWLVKVITIKATLDGRWDQLQRLTYCDSGSSFGEAVWHPMELLIDAVAELVGAGDSLSWFIWDNESGDRSLQHSLPNGEMRSVGSVDDLLDVLGY